MFLDKVNAIVLFFCGFVRSLPSSCVWSHDDMLDLGSVTDQRIRETLTPACLAGLSGRRNSVAFLRFKIEIDLTVV